MGNQPMLCARCGTRRWWPRDFPNTTYAICYQCAAIADAQERKAIEQRSTIFFYVLFAGLAITAIVTGVALAFC